MNMGTYKFVTCKQEEDLNNLKCIEIDTPVIDEAFKHSEYLHLIISGTVHIMDHAGMYGYAKIKGGSYFGDISILLGRANKYSYMYNPHQEKPLQLL